MFFKPSRDNMTTKELLNEIMSLGNFECLENKNRNLYILYNEKNLLVSPGIQALRIKFLKNPNEKQVDCNCKNIEALERIDKLEKVIKSIIYAPNPEDIFDYLPYTKQGKFSKSASINLYIPNISSTYSGNYFSQSEISLQLIPLAMPKNSGNLFEEIHSNEICVLEINEYASFTSRKKPENIIDENGNYKKLTPVKRNTYLKQQDITIGTSYIDAKGSEYLYIGNIIEDIYFENERNGVPYSGQNKKQYEGLYLRITPKIKKDLNNYSYLGDFLYDRFNKILLKEAFDWWKGLNMTTSKKFVKLENVYFDNSHNKIPNNKLEFAYPKGTYYKSTYSNYRNMSTKISLYFN